MSVQRLKSRVHFKTTDNGNLGKECVHSSLLISPNECFFVSVYSFRCTLVCSISTGFLTTPPTKIMVLAAANSELSQAAATVSELWNLVQVRQSFANILTLDINSYWWLLTSSIQECLRNTLYVHL